MRFWLLLIKIFRRLFSRIFSCKQAIRLDKRDTIRGITLFSMLDWNWVIVTSALWKLPFSPSTRGHENGVFKKFHPGERFQKVTFSVTESSGYVWTVEENGWKSLRFRKNPSPCGRGLTIVPHWRWHLLYSPWTLGSNEVHLKWEMWSLSNWMKTTL